LKKSTTAPAASRMRRVAVVHAHPKLARRARAYAEPLLLQQFFWSVAKPLYPGGQVICT